MQKPEVSPLASLAGSHSEESLSLPFVYRRQQCVLCWQVISARGRSKSKVTRHMPAIAEPSKRSDVYHIPPPANLGDDSAWWKIPEGQEAFMLFAYKAPLAKKAGKQSDQKRLCRIPCQWPTHWTTRTQRRVLSATLGFQRKSLLRIRPLLVKSNYFLKAEHEHGWQSAARKQWSCDENNKNLC